MKVCYRMGIVFALAIQLFSSQVFAGGVRSEKEAIALAESAMKKIVVDDVEGATEILRPHASIDWGELNALTKHVSESYRARPAGFGDPLGYVYVKHESLGDTVLRVTFIEKFKRKPLQWEFFFYKPAQDWLLMGFVFSASDMRMFNLAPTTPPQTSQPPSR